MAESKPAATNRLTAAAPFLRDIVFGVHDALLTNIGIVTGFVAALQSNDLIVLTVFIDIIISAFAMSFGTYLSRTSESDYLQGQLHEEAHADVASALGNPVTASIVMWVTYVIAGFIPLLPFLFGLDPAISLRYAVVLSLIVFFVIGCLKGVMTGTSVIRGGLQFVLFGGTAAVIGYAIGTYGQQLLAQ